MLCLNLSVLVKRVVQGDVERAFLFSRQKGNKRREYLLKYSSLEVTWLGRFPWGVLTICLSLESQFLPGLAEGSGGT